MVVVELKGSYIRNALPSADGYGELFRNSNLETVGLGANLIVARGYIDEVETGRSRALQSEREGTAKTDASRVAPLHQRQG